MPHDGPCTTGNLPRFEKTGCCFKCGHLIPTQPSAVEPPVVTRDPNYEAMLVAQAARAVGRGHAAAGLNQFADLRAGTDPVRGITDRDFDQETFEELADARNYLCWRIAQLRDRVAAGDEIAGAAWDRTLGALQGVVIAWDALVPR